MHTDLASRVRDARPGLRAVIVVLGVVATGAVSWL